MVTVQTLTAVVNQLLPEPHAGLLTGILFGTKTTLSPELYQALVATGTLHIVALSGMNITILINLVDLFLLGFVSRRIASLLTMGAITGFVWFVGASASVVRAAIMGSIGLLAVVFGRQTWALLSWLLAISTMLLLNLAWLTDLSFQLSALATLGIILFGRSRAAEVGMLVSASPPSLSPAAPASPSASGVALLEKARLPAALLSKNVLPSRLLWWLWSMVRDDLRLTLSAQVFTIPLIFFYFHRVSLISPLTNLLIGWVLPPLTAAGILTVIVGYIFWPLGQAIGWVAWVPLEYLITVVELTSKVPGASMGW